MPGARFGYFDIKNDYYGTLMKIRKYTNLHISKIPKEIINKYNLNNIVSPNRWVYIDIRKLIPVLKQAGRIENNRLTSYLANFGYSPTRLIPGLCKHESRPITFSLVVDDFGVKYVEKKHANHLLASLQKLYTMTEYWTGILLVE